MQKKDRKKSFRKYFGYLSNLQEANSDKIIEELNFQSSTPGIYEQKKLKNRADSRDKSFCLTENLPFVSLDDLHTF